MPVSLTHPGVFFQEVPSGAQPIQGVPTSITAFIGRANRGLVNEAKVINSFAEYERFFGGLDLNSSLSFSVQDYFLNGGSQAIIVRLYHPDTGVGELPSKSSFTVSTVQLEAYCEGSWGGNLRAEVDLNVSAEDAAQLGLVQADLFNLTVTDSISGGVTEKLLNVSFKDSVRRVDKVLIAESQLVRWKGGYTAPVGDPIPGVDSVTEKEAALEAVKAVDPVVPNDVSHAENELITAQAGVKASDGEDLTKGDDFTPINAAQNKVGLYALEQVDLFNILCLPPYLTTLGKPNSDVDVSLIAVAAAYCEKRRVMLLVDSPSDWDSKTEAVDQFTDVNEDHIGTRSKNAALFFPRINKPDPLRGGQLESFVPCGAIAGLFSRTDTQRGVWKAAAGTGATLTAVQSLSVSLTDSESGELNPLGVNCLRRFPRVGQVVWGSRTLSGADQLSSEWKYIPVRRTALYIEESLYRGTQWVVFEPNDEPLWAQISSSIEAFMNNLFREGAFQGTKASEAYFVKCDKDTTTQNDIDRGIVNFVVGFAPLKPAEFVILKFQHVAGEL